MKSNYKILAINPGSTTTKIGVYDGDQEILKVSLEHSTSELAQYDRVISQYEMRKTAVLAYLRENKIDIDQLQAIAARGAPMSPLNGGAYRVNEAMVARLKSGLTVEHASNLAAIIAYEIGQEHNIPSYIYDAISTDELDEIARISGMPAIPRVSLVHTLNMRAACHKIAIKMRRPYSALRLIVVHLGGGITISVHREGRMIDIVSDDEGPFSPERAGRVPCRNLIESCYSGQYDYATMRKMLSGRGGLMAYTGTSSAIDVEKMIEDGDERARLIYEAMAYQIAKGIGELATVVNGQVDAIILTGGIAHSEMLTGWIRDRVKFIAPVEIVPGENELESLAKGVTRVLNGEEKAKEFAID